MAGVLMVNEASSGRLILRKAILPPKAAPSWPFEIVDFVGPLKEVVRDQGIDVVVLERIVSAEQLTMLGETLQAIQLPLICLGILPTGTMDYEGDVLRDMIFPLIDIMITPSGHAARLVGLPLNDDIDMRRVARTIGHMGVSALLILGGDEFPGRDLIWADAQPTWCEENHVPKDPVVLALAAATVVAQQHSPSHALHAAYQWVLSQSDQP